jgi:hypothetical protein
VAASADGPLLLAMIDRRKKLEENVFEFPPQTWEEFHQRLGRWIEVNETINMLSIEKEDKAV